MARVCAFVHCNNTKVLFSFPRNSTRAEVWLHAAGLRCPKKTHGKYICKEHFFTGQFCELETSANRFHGSSFFFEERCCASSCPLYHPHKWGTVCVCLNRHCFSCLNSYYMILSSTTFLQLHDRACSKYFTDYILCIFWFTYYCYIISSNWFINTHFSLTLFNSHAFDYAVF